MKEIEYIIVVKTGHSEKDIARARSAKTFILLFDEKRIFLQDVKKEYSSSKRRFRIL